MKATTIPPWTSASTGGAFCRLFAAACLSAFAAFAWSTDALSQELPVIRNNSGAVGALDLPTARMTESGELSVGAAFQKNTQRYFLDWEIFPWLEASFRYSGLSHFDPAYPVYYDRAFALKARLWDETAIWPSFVIGANDLVGTGLYAGEYLAASKRIGALDLTAGIGFGRLGDSDLFRNPLADISNSFSKRTRFPAIIAGATAFNTLFHGANAGAFGSIVWNTPLDGLSLIAEYSSDTYSLEHNRGNFTPLTQMNFGLSYDLSSSLSASLAWMYGTSLSARLSFQLDPTRPQYLTKIAPPVPEAHIRTPDEQRAGIIALSNLATYSPSIFNERNEAKNAFVDSLWSAKLDIVDVQLKGENLVIRTMTSNTVATCEHVGHFLPDESQIATVDLLSDHSKPIQCLLSRNKKGSKANSLQSNATLMPIVATHIDEIDAENTDLAPVRAKVRQDIERQDLYVAGMTFAAGEVTIYYSNNHYFSEVQALNRLTRVLMADLPPEIESFKLISMTAGVPQQQFTVLRSVAERHQEQEEDINLFTGAIRQVPAPMGVSLSTADERGFPQFYWSVFPQFRQQLFDPSNPFAVQFLAAASASVELARGLSVNAEGELDIYNNFNTGRISDSLLPHVRSDFVKYFTQGKNGLGELDTLYRFRLAPTVFGVVKAGYLESMFAGAGGEILWRPEGARWGVGVDGYEVWQRNYDRLFGLLPYRTFTGHVSLYYQAPWYNLNFALRAGQYLAGDKGATLEITRRFSTGVEIGAFVTETNVSAAQFGEGSFDKGIIIRIPIGWAAPIESQALFAMDLRPVQRDGGQRLGGDAWLWEETRRSSEGEIRNTLGLN